MVDRRMSWLRKIYKGSSSTMSKGHHQEKSGDNDDEVCNETANSRLLSGYESENLDHVNALTLSKEELKKRITTGTKSNADENEQLAQALQEKLITKSPPPKSREIPRICVGCENEIGRGKFLSLVGALWHPKCFNCYACGQPIIGDDFSTYEDHPYHMSCYQNLRPKCDVCKEFVPTKRNGKPHYYEHPFWKQKSCPSHQHDGTHKCISCQRKEPQGANYSRLDDRLLLCLECLDCSIMDFDECRPLYRDIKNFYKGLNMDVDREIRLHLVESEVLSKGKEKHRFPLPDNILGLCRVHKQSTESTKSKEPKISILVLKGLPRILTGLSIAHEMMHGWLRLNGYPYGKLDPYVEEGICVVMSYMWLETEMISGTDSNVAFPSSSSSSAPYRKGPRSIFESKLGEYWKCKLENNVCPIYGDGFRAGHAVVLKYGIKTVLDHIKSTGSFPH